MIWIKYGNFSLVTVSILWLLPKIFFTDHVPLGTAKSIAVQVTFAEGTESEIVCKNP